MEWIADIVDFFVSGGAFMVPILLVLAIGTAIILERIRFLSRMKTDVGSLWSGIQTAIQNDQLSEAIRQCEESPGVVPKMLLSGLQKAKELAHYGEKKPITLPELTESREELENAVEESMLEIMPEMEKRTHYLPTLANVATLLGLLGTIMGLIQSFKAVSVADPAQKAVLLSQGIAVAMNTTAFGLIVAIPIMLVYAYLQARTIQMVDHLDAYSVKLINLLTSRETAHGVKAS
ncbi:MAG: MotA/TolQ/ExbB proton channel family protein [Nitrospirae bacterium]|nr:MotA/TolQ/ExbB proton channel family protein [Nitrospirota bacterium]